MSRSCERGISRSAFLGSAPAFARSGNHFSTRRFRRAGHMNLRSCPAEPVTWNRGRLLCLGADCQPVLPVVAEVVTAERLIAIESRRTTPICPTAAAVVREANACADQYAVRPIASFNRRAVPLRRRRPPNRIAEMERFGCFRQRRVSRIVLGRTR